MWKRRNLSCVGRKMWTILNPAKGRYFWFFGLPVQDFCSSRSALESPRYNPLALAYLRGNKGLNYTHTRVHTACKPDDKLNTLIERRCSKRLVIGRTAYRFNARNITKVRFKTETASCIKVAAVKCTPSLTRGTGRLVALHANYNKHF